jgi:hypothetical protein
MGQLQVREVILALSRQNGRKGRRAMCLYFLRSANSSRSLSAAMPAFH